MGTSIRLLTFNTPHLLANLSGGWSRGNRHARAEEAALKQLADALSVDHPDPLLAVGDFNVPRGSWLLGEFLARAGLHDVLAGDRRPTYRPTPRIPASIRLSDWGIEPGPGAVPARAAQKLCPRGTHQRTPPPRNPVRGLPST